MSETHLEPSDLIHIPGRVSDGQENGRDDERPAHGDGRPFCCALQTKPTGRHFARPRAREVEFAHETARRLW